MIILDNLKKNRLYLIEITLKYCDINKNNLNLKNKSELITLKLDKGQNLMFYNLEFLNLLN
jgi:hypothetical protein